MSLENSNIVSGVIGLYTCSCHLFKSYDEAKYYKNQKLVVGDPVKNRCTGRSGIVFSFCEQRGYLIVKYGVNPCDQHLEHKQELLKIEAQQKLDFN